MKRVPHADIWKKKSPQVISPEQPRLRATDIISPTPSFDRKGDWVPREAICLTKKTVLIKIRNHEVEPPHLIGEREIAYQMPGCMESERACMAGQLEALFPMWLLPLLARDLLGPGFPFEKVRSAQNPLGHRLWDPMFLVREGKVRKLALLVPTSTSKFLWPVPSCDWSLCSQFYRFEEAQGQRKPNELKKVEWLKALNFKL